MNDGFTASKGLIRRVKTLKTDLGTRSADTLSDVDAGGTIGVAMFLPPVADPGRFCAMGTAFSGFQPSTIAVCQLR